MASSGGDGNGGSGDEDGVGFGLGLGLGLGYGSDSSVHEAHLIRHIDRTILACQICRKRFRDPKVLPCFHTFCLGCLSTHVPPESLALSCPDCGQQAILPQIGLRGLQTNFFLASLIELVHDEFDNSPSASTFVAASANDDLEISTSDYESQTFSSIVDIEGVEYVVHSNDSSLYDPTWQLRYGCEQQHHQILTTATSRTLFCSKHQGQSLRFFCENCETAVCSSCTDIEHQQHDTVTMAEAADKDKQELQELINKAQAQIPAIKDVLENINALSTTLAGKQTDLSNVINEAFDQLVTMVENRRTATLKELADKEKAKQDRLGGQREELEARLADVYTSCEFVEKALANGSDTEVLLVKKQVGETLDRLGRMEVDTELVENQHLVFLPGSPEDMRELLAKWGSVQSSSAVAWRTEAATGPVGIRQSFVGRPSFVTITAKDFQGQSVRGPEVEEFYCEIVPVSLLNRASKAIELTTELTDMEDGTFELTYTLPVEGKFELVVKMLGDHVAGSPFKISASWPPAEESTHSSSGSAYRRIPMLVPKKVRSKSHMHNYQHVNVSNNHYHHHHHHHHPHLHSGPRSDCSRNNPIEDDLILKIGSRGRGKAEFTNPQGVAVSASGRIYLADSNNQCVQCFGPQGELRLRFGVRGRCPGQMQRPTGICVLPDGHVAVADYDNKWVSIFDQTGKFINRIGSGKLLGPKGVAVDHAGHLVVVDNKASSVLIFQRNGKLLHRFGSRGGDEDHFAGPHYVAINSHGHIIISDFHNHSIKVFDSKGVFLFSFGTNGEGNGQFNAPTGIAVDSQDNILVADWGNSRIQVFDCHGSFLAFVNTVACPLYGPQGLALTHDGNIVVADSGNHCFKLYRYLQ